MKKWVKLLSCLAGIYTFFITQNYITEYIYKTKQPDGTKYSFSGFMLLWSYGLSALVSWILVKVTNDQSSLPVAYSAKLGALYGGATGSSMTAMKYISAPTQILAKSIKILPVALFSLIGGKRKYSTNDYVTALVATIGMGVYNLEELKRSAGESEILGIVCIVSSLFFDGWLGYAEDDVKVEHNVSGVYMMASTSLFSSIFALIYCVVSGELIQAISYLVLHPAYIQYMVLYGVVSVAGVLCVFATVVTFGSLVNSILTTTRKFVSIFVSIYLFNHPCSSIQCCAIFVIFVSVCYNLFVEHFTEKKDPKKAHAE